MGLEEWIASAQARLERAGVDSARLEAQVLAAHVLLVDRTWIIAHPEADFPDLAGESVLARRLAHEPLAYIVGYREFYGRRFIVRPGVLIPRQETEVLVDAALEIDNPQKSVLDIGTGSGCLAITLALERPNWRVVGSDLSADALEIAHENGRVLSAGVEWVHSDACEGFKLASFDLIVSNPPYVSRTDALSLEIKDFEPEMALYATGDGLDFYRRLSKECGALLTAHGTLIMELGAGQAAAIRKLFEEAGWHFQKIWKDLDGHDRGIAFQLNS